MIGRYLGTEIYVGPEITANIMKSNGEVMYRSTYRGLQEEEKSNQSHVLLRKEFDNNIGDKLGPDIPPGKFLGFNLEDTPLYEMYEDDTTDAECGFPGNNKDYEDPVMATGLDREVPTTEVNYNYVNNSVMLPRVNSYARGKVVGRKIYAYENAVGRTNNNLIIDTR